MEINVDPNARVENIMWHNRRYEAYGLLCLSISRYLFFHLDGLTSPNHVWEKFKNIFENKNEMGGHQLENELISLSQRNCEPLQVYLLNFKALVLQLKHCGIEKKVEQLVLAIILNLGLHYSVFVSTIHASN